MKAIIYYSPDDTGGVFTKYRRFAGRNARDQVSEFVRNEGLERATYEVVMIDDDGTRRSNRNEEVRDESVASHPAREKAKE